MKITIRKAKLTDVLNIAKMHRSSFMVAHEQLYPQGALKKLTKQGFVQRWKKRLSGQRERTYIAEAKGEVIGLICFSLAAPIKIAEILFLYIQPHCFRQGIGKKLMLYVLERLKKKHIKMVHLWALKNNPKSRAFYESLGACTDGTERMTNKPVKSTHEVEYFLFPDNLTKRKYILRHH